MPAASPLDVVLLRPRVTNGDSIRTVNGNAGEALAESLEVLRREHGRRHQDGDLLAVLQSP